MSLVKSKKLHNQLLDTSNLFIDTMSPNLCAAVYLLSETFEVFVPEGTFVEYVMESFERSYLSFLMSVSYYYLIKSDSAQVELRRAYLEGQAFIYNYGDDAVNLILQAILWENVGDKNMARPLWKRALELLDTDSQAKFFVEKRIVDIDLISSGRSSWKIMPLGAFEGFDWSFKMNGFNIFSKKTFSPSCSHETGLYISTEKWAQKIAKRHEYEYHPLLNLKSLARLPVATGYGLVAGTGAVGVGVGGCVIGGYLKDNSGKICKASIEASGYLLQQTKDLFEGTVRPDLRHWKKFPVGFLITRDEKKDPCHPSSDDNFPRKKILD